MHKFGKVAAEWWDPKGSFRPLHELNPVRVAFMRDAICDTLRRAPCTPSCLALALSRARSAHHFSTSYVSQLRCPEAPGPAQAGSALAQPRHTARSAQAQRVAAGAAGGPGGAGRGLRRRAAGGGARAPGRGRDRRGRQRRVDRRRARARGGRSGARRGVPRRPRRAAGGRGCARSERPVLHCADFGRTRAVGLWADSRLGGLALSWPAPACWMPLVRRQGRCQLRLPRHCAHQPALACDQAGSEQSCITDRVVGPAAPSVPCHCHAVPFPRRDRPAAG